MSFGRSQSRPYRRALPALVAASLLVLTFPGLLLAFSLVVQGFVPAGGRQVAMQVLAAVLALLVALVLGFAGSVLTSELIR